jgi:hypothetical protein
MKKFWSELGKTIYQAMGKILSARFLLAIAAAWALVKLTATVSRLITTPEQAKDVLMIVGPLISMIITFYFLRTDRGQDVPGTQETVTKTTNTSEPAKPAV